MELILAYVGLGANLGDPVQQIDDAITRLTELPGVVKSRCSSLYVTSPIGCSNQADFINCVLELHVRLSAVELFSALQLIENQLGRSRDPNNQNSPRVIDCDLLLFGDEVIDSEDLIVPHPRMAQRLFVLQPLVELNSAVEITQLGRVDEVLRQGDFKGQIIHRYLGD